MATVTPELTRTLGRLRGEQNITITNLARQVQVSRQVVSKVLSGKQRTVKTRTLAKLNEWIYKQI